MNTTHKTHTSTRARRHVVVVDNSDLARAVGGRIRRARQAAGVTQKEVAGERYTPAYISALETGGAKPSMAALRYLSDRLGTPVRALVAEEPGQWEILRADLSLAAGDWQTAADLYASLLERPLGQVSRLPAHLGLSEALCRLDRGREAAAHAAEAQQLAQRAGDGVSAASAGYWLAAAQSQLDNPREARAILEEVLASVRGGVRVTSDFRIRLLIALATVESQEEAHDHALAYLEEARGLASDLDDLRRARFLFNLAVEYQQTADYEAALRTASQSAALFRAAQADRELAALENTTALTFLGMGNLERAEESLQRARDAVTGEDDPFAPHVAETEARLALAEGRIDAARLAASKAIELAREAGYHKTVALALLTRAEAELQANEPIAALATFEDAATIAREHGGRGLLRRVLGRWAETLTSLGRLEEATKLYQEALSA